MIDIKATFEKYDDEFNKFDRVDPRLRRSQRPDLCAFILLNLLVPGDEDIVGDSSDYRIYLSVRPETLAEVAKESDIATLVRCGVRYDKEDDCLYIFV